MTLTFPQRTAAMMLIAIIIVAVFVFPVLSLAHEGEQHASDEEAAAHIEQTPQTLEGTIRKANVDALLWVTLALELLVGASVLGSSGGRVLKSGMRKFLFGGIVLVTVATTVFIAGSTIFLNVVSVTGGPIHWHADFRLLNCGEEIDIVDPSGLSNKVGTPVLHEHGDNRIHVEGVVVKIEEAHLDTFFNVIGGELLTDRLVVPTNDGVTTLQTGDRCADGSVGVLQAFLWETDESGDKWVARQRKLGSDFPSHLMKPESLIPPGDCIIIELAPEKERTDHLCVQYEVAEIRGDMTIER